MSSTPSAHEDFLAICRQCRVTQALARSPASMAAIFPPASALLLLIEPGRRL